LVARSSTPPLLNGGLGKGYFEKVNSVPLKFFMAPFLTSIYDYAFNLYGKGEKESVAIDSSDFHSLLPKSF
jgi:hypothetical protein